MEQKQLDEELMQAVINGDIEKATQAIVDGANIHIKTPKGNNLLYVAATKNQYSMFSWLLEIEKDGKKIEINNQNNDGSTTLLELISENGMNKYIRKLIEFKADPNITSKDGMSPLILACSEKKIDTVELLLEIPNIKINYQIPHTLTSAFLMAVSQSSLPICELLKAKGANINALDSQGKNALITSIYKTTQYMKKKEKAEHEALCLFLVDSGIDLNYEAPSGMTAFWAASLLESPKIAMAILDKGTINVDVWHEIGLEGRTSAMHLWCNKKNPEMVQRLHKLGAKLGTLDANGNTPEAYGFSNKHLRKTMLDLNADVNSIVHIGGLKADNQVIKIPVISQVISGGNDEKEIVEEMINRGAIVTFPEEMQSYEPIMISISLGADEIVESLLRTKQINLNKPIKTNPLSSNMTPLQLLVSGITSQKINAFLEQKQLIKELQKAKAQNDKNNIQSNLINTEDFEKINEDLKKIEAIEQELDRRRKDMFDLMIMNGADVNQVNEDDRSAIFFCANTEYANWLKEKKADFFLKDKNGNNPLIYSIINNKNNLIEYLKYEYKDVQDETINNVFYQLAFTEVKNYLQQENLEKGIREYIKDEVPVEEIFKEENKDEIFHVEHINYQDEDGNSPLLVACANNLPFLASLYIKLGAEINLKNNEDETAIMHAIATDNDKLVDFLIDKGADITCVTKSGKSVLDFAEETKNKAIIEKVKIALGYEIREGTLSNTIKIK
jgi:serine/threonine-protein phosphatase 6 regulatory ankyrin repeat subunit B